MRLGFSGSVFAAAIGALVIAATPAAALAQSPGSNDGSTWSGLNHPGRTDPSDPHNNKWNCDRHGNWHNDEHDAHGHKDPRCTKW
ncbi:hypothetical protein OG203_43810 [Nocardia sp. NBC_01499]|uniref:hypothetical protein n=1 Tax=Nocardia sp. NBC_01499 TaxID=2903597 RepID=UPI00386E08BE